MNAPFFWKTEKQFTTTKSPQECFAALEAINHDREFYPHLKAKIDGARFEVETESRLNKVLLVGEINGQTVTLVAGGGYGALLPFVQLVISSMVLLSFFPTLLMGVVLVVVWLVVTPGIYLSFGLMRDRVMAYVFASLR